MAQEQQTPDDYDRRQSDRRGVDHALAWRVGELEGDIKEVRADLRDLDRKLDSSFKEIDRKLDHAFSSDGPVGRVATKISEYDTDRKSWKNLMTVFGLVATLLGGTITYIVTKIIDFVTTK